MGIKHKLSIAGFSLATAVLGATACTILSILAMLGLGEELVKSLSSLLLGFDASAAGLFVGIIAYLGYNYLVTRVQKVVHNMEYTSIDFIDLLQEPR